MSTARALLLLAGAACLAAGVPDGDPKGVWARERSRSIAICGWRAAQTCIPACAAGSGWESGGHLARQPSLPTCPALPALLALLVAFHNRRLLTGYGGDFLTSEGTVAGALGDVRRLLHRPC